VLYRFCQQANCSDGANPTGALMLDLAGNLYGTARAGGNACSNSAGCGVVFRLSADGVYTVLYSFCTQVQNNVCADGADPAGRLIEDSSGNLYGTTMYGGGACMWSDAGCGTVFELSPSGQENVLYAFCTTGQYGECGDGYFPQFGLTMDEAGNLPFKMTIWAVRIFAESCSK